MTLFAFLQERQRITILPIQLILSKNFLQIEEEKPLKVAMNRDLLYFWTGFTRFFGSFLYFSLP
jgi:hypothetical protein